MLVTTQDLKENLFLITRNLESKINNEASSNDVSDEDWEFFKKKLSVY